MAHRALSTRTSSTLSLPKYYTPASHLSEHSSDASSKNRGSGSSSAPNCRARVWPVVSRPSVYPLSTDEYFEGADSIMQRRNHTEFLQRRSSAMLESRQRRESGLMEQELLEAKRNRCGWLKRRLSTVRWKGMCRGSGQRSCVVMRFIRGHQNTLTPTVSHAGGMLARATTACLKARAARDSLPCAQQHHARRASTRLLHHTFWTHGAGDLNLPPYIVSPTPPVDLSLRHDDISAPKNSRVVAAPDGVFLDFLYPPQALAHLQRANRRQLESWEHRNARRLPGGVVRASRHYSSTSRVKSLRATSAPDPEPQPEAAEQQEMVDVEKAAMPERDALGEVAGEHTDTVRAYQRQPMDLAKELGVGNDTDTRTGVSNAAVAEDGVSQFAGFADSPADIDEAQPHGTWEHGSVRQEAAPLLVDIPHEPALRLRHLRFLLEAKPHQITRPVIRQAWQLYLSLHDVDKQDLRLKEKLLVWLNEREDELADAYITALFWSFPLAARTLPIYQTVVESLLRAKAAHELLSVIHTEALVNLSNGHQVSLQLFTHALGKGNVTALNRAVKEHNRTVNATGQLVPLELLWLKVAELPGLVSRVKSLLKGRYKTRKARPLRVRLAQEAVQQATERLFEDQDSPDPSSDILALLDIINQIDSNAATFFRSQLVLLLPALNQYNVEKHLNPRYTKVREKAHRIISYLYWHSRACDDAKLHQDLMLIWLKHLTSRMDTTNKEDRSERNVTAGMVIEDWQAWYGQLSADAVHNLISYSAHAGAVEALNKWTAYLNRRFPSYQEQRKAFWAQVYVHAKLSDLPAAKGAFKAISRSAQAHGDRIDLKCWNVLLHAHQQADDLEGAMETFKELLQRTKLVPDSNSFAPIVNMLARRGDVDALEDILQQFDVFTQEKRATHFVHAQIMALNLIDDAPRAELLLQESIHKVRQGEIIGSMTECVNLMLAKYASMRDIDATMRVYRTMQRQNIFRNAATYRHLMQVLANFRQTNAAWAILTKGMRNDGFVPTAAHYTVIMAGFNNEDEPDKAIMAHEHMLFKNIRESLSTKENLVKAKMLMEKKAHVRDRNSGEEVSEPLANALLALKAMVADLSPRDISSQFRPGGFKHTAQDVFSPVIWALGGERRLHAVQQLFQDSHAAAKEYSHSPWPTIRLSAGLMNALYHAKEFAQVEKYWKLVKEQIDGIVPSTPVPDFLALRQLTRENSTSDTAVTTASAGPKTDEGAELGFKTDQDSEDGASRTPTRSVQASRLGPRPAPARRGVLTRPFRIYLASLAAQNRTEDAIREATRLLTQGYTFDSITWNRFIEYIAGSDPPMALLAFTLTERFLISSFPGWIGMSPRRWKLRKSIRALGMQYIKARYVAPGVLIPQYRTFIWLARALLEVRRRESVGWQGQDERQTVNANVKRFIGTTEQIREKAPGTLRAVQMMPRIDDKWQNRLLRNIGWKFPSEGDQQPTIGDAQLVSVSDIIEQSSEPLTDEDLAFLTAAGIDTGNAPRGDGTRAIESSEELQQELSTREVSAEESAPAVESGYLLDRKDNTT
ncbi:hypothetical protein CERZMDRAFT_117410 [Cercospora zeae-maydis SCOH1-5]|uniref:Pentacotripeptide-repeat region of PRORP domain-containing protein n=1 Tax=Cercospora zeae-maydis SCOH1-5 TaxID=717836 RepID=A0A6A6FIH3_9PEZI|nr:hypothetical protein CERZMDRAFT_117410 [Cercospora zeae-maydis SCOH1-5]